MLYVEYFLLLEKSLNVSLKRQIKLSPDSPAALHSHVTIMWWSDDGHVTVMQWSRDHLCASVSSSQTVNPDGFRLKPLFALIKDRD